MLCTELKELTMILATPNTSVLGQTNLEKPNCQCVFNDCELGCLPIALVSAAHVAVGEGKTL